jgi:HlyD family secretion protein
MRVNLKTILRKKKLLIAAAVVIALVIAYAVVPGARAKVPVVPIETANVLRGDIKLSIETKGLFQSEHSVAVVPDIQGGAMITSIVPDGSYVKKGDVICRLDTKDVEDEVNDLTMRVANARNNEAQAEQARTIQQTANDAAIATAEIALRMNKFASDQYGVVLLASDGQIDDEAYSRPGAPPKGDAYQAASDAIVAIKKAQSDLEQAETDFNGMDKLLEKGFISKSDFLNAQVKVEEGRHTLESKKLALDILRTYTYPQTRAKNIEAVKDAESSYKTALMTAEVHMTEVDTALRSAQRQLLRMSNRLSDHKKELEKRTIFAPIDGQVLYGDPIGAPWMRDHIAVGQQVWRGLRLFTIPDLSSIVVRTRLLEVDVNAVAVGRDVEVTVPDALPNVVFKGKLTQIAEYASDNGWWMASRNAKGFDAMVRLESTDERVKPGMSCSVEIMQGRVSDCLYVPVSAVLRKGDKTYCTVVSGQEQRSVEVSTGAMSEKYVEVKSGLSEGQKVVLNESKPAPGAGQTPQGQPQAGPKGGGA